MGYVTQDAASKRYSLGSRLIYLGAAAQKSIALTEVASEPEAAEPEPEREPERELIRA